MQNPDRWPNKSFRGQGKSTAHMNLNKNAGSFGTGVVNPEQLYIENKSSSYTSYYLNPGNGIDNNQSYDGYFPYSKPQEQPKVEEVKQAVQPVVSRDPRLQKRSAELAKGTVSEPQNVGTLVSQISNSPSAAASNQTPSPKFESVKRYKNCASSVFSPRGNSVTRNSSFSSRFSSPRGALKKSPPKNRFFQLPPPKVNRYTTDWKRSPSADRRSGNQDTLKGTLFDSSSRIKSQPPEISSKNEELSKNELTSSAQLSKDSSSCSKFKPAPSTDKSVENLINKLFTDEQQKQFLASKQKDTSIKSKNVQNKKLSLPEKVLRKKLSTSAFNKSKLNKKSVYQKDAACSVFDSENEIVLNSTLSDQSKSNDESLPMTLLADSLSDVAANFLDILATSDSLESSSINTDKYAVKHDTDYPVLPNKDKTVSKTIIPEMDAQKSVLRNTVSDGNSLLESECDSKFTSGDIIEEVNLVHPINVTESVENDDIHTSNQICYSERPVDSDINEEVCSNEIIEDHVSDEVECSNEIIEDHVSDEVECNNEIIEDHVSDEVECSNEIIEDHVSDKVVCSNEIIEAHVSDEIVCSNDIIEDPVPDEVVGDNEIIEDHMSDEVLCGDKIIEVQVSAEVVCGNEIIKDSVFKEVIHGNEMIENHISDEVCGNEIIEDPVSKEVYGNEIIEHPVSNELLCGNEITGNSVSISVNEIEVNNSEGEPQNNASITTENIISETASEIPETVTEEIIVDESSEYCIIAGELDEDLVDAQFIFIPDENNVPQLHRISIPENGVGEFQISRVMDESLANELRKHFLSENIQEEEVICFPSGELPSNSDVPENMQVEQHCFDPLDNSKEARIPESFSNADICEISQVDKHCTDTTNNVKEALLPQSLTDTDICDSWQVEKQHSDSANNSNESSLPQSFHNDVICEGVLSNDAICEGVRIEQNCADTSVSSKELILPGNLTNEDICESLNKIFGENIPLDKNPNNSNLKNISDACEELCFNLEPLKAPSSPTDVKIVSESLDVKTNPVQNSEILILNSDLSVESEKNLTEASNEIVSTDELCLQEPVGSTNASIINVQSDNLVECFNTNDTAEDQDTVDKNVDTCSEGFNVINSETNINKCDLLNNVKNKFSSDEMIEGKLSPSKAKKTIQPSSLKINNSASNQNIDEIINVSSEESTSDLSTVKTKSNNVISQGEEKLRLASELMYRKSGEVLNVTYKTLVGVSKKTVVTPIKINDTSRINLNSSGGGTPKNSGSNISKKTFVTPIKVNETSKTNLDSSGCGTHKMSDSNVLGEYTLNTSSSDSENDSSKTSLMNNSFQKSNEGNQNHKRKAEDSPAFSGKVAKKSLPQSTINQSPTQFSGTSPSNSCTVALKTFKKPFTAAKKSFVESREKVTKNVALKSVVKKPSFPKTSYKSLIKNNQAKKCAESNTLNPDEIGAGLNQQIANIMQQGYTLVSRTGQKIFVLPSDFQFKIVPNGSVDVLSEEESRSNLAEICSPVKDIMKFKSSCSCAAEEIPCICNNEKLQETCEAEDTIDEKVVLCTNNVSKQYLLTPSSEIRHRAYCDIHFWRLRQHHCCPKCGIFCTQGKFLACTSEQPKLNHLFHLNCFLVPGPGLPPGCPHCCEFSNFNKVHLLMKQKDESNNEAENNDMKTMTNITEDLKNCKILMKIITESQNLYGAAGFAPSKQELQSVVKSLVHDKTLRLRPTGNNLYNPIKTGDVKKVVQIIANGVSPNYRFKAHKNNTPLHIAASCGFVGIIHVLLQAGALIDSCNDDLEAPLLLAVDGNHLAAVKYLMYAGAQMNVKDENGLTAFHRATKNGFKDVAQFLYDTGCFDINIQDNGGWTPLVWTCEHKHILVVRWLLELGADPNIHDKEENTALHWTAYSGESKIAEELLHHGCNISFVNQRGDSALHIAARENNFDCVKLFLMRGAALDTRNKENKTAIMCCQERSASWNILNQALGFAKLGKLPAEQNVVFKDISRGTEFFPIQAVNEVDDEEFITEFQYVTSYCDRTGVDIVRTVNSMRFCDCTDDCLSGICVCAKSSKTVYDENGCLVCDFDNDTSPIFECNKTCHCPRTCSNRVVQKGIRFPLQLFRTHSRGWGVRSLKDLPKGAFVCEYVGEIITEKEAEERGNDTYFFDLESQDEEYYVDGRYYGNVSRFFNHSCEPNLVAKKVYIDHQDLNFPRIAFFTKRATVAYEELCFDYGIDFWIVKSRSILCTCNTNLCKYSKDSIDNTIQLYLEERSTMEDSMSVDDS